jgi:hypothetical protein
VANNKDGQSRTTPSWVMWLMGSLVPFTAFTFVDATYRTMTGGIALAMVAIALVMVWREE